MGTIQSGLDTTLATVGSTSKSVYSELRSTTGETVTPADWGTITPGTSPATMAGGMDYKSAHVLRTRPDGSLTTAVDSLLFWDPIEGAALNTNLWVSTLTSWTVATVASGVMLLNPASTLTATTGQLLTSIPRIPRYPRVPIVSRTSAKPGAHVSGSVHEIGFGNPASATAATVGDGAFFRKDTSGQWMGVLSINGVEILATAISDATFVALVPAGDYAEFEIILYDDRAEFVIENRAGALVYHQYINWNSSGTGNPNFTASHLVSMIRSYNNSAVASAVQLAIGGHAVVQLDMPSGKTIAEISAINGYGVESHPTTFGQTANYSNNAAPTTRTVTNTTALEATLGGHVSWNNAGTAFAGDDTKDWILFAFQAPTTFGLLIKGLRVGTINLGAANGANPYTIEYAISTNLSAVSLATAAPNGPRFRVLGAQSIAASAAIGATFSDPITMNGLNIYVEPGKFFHLVGRVLTGAATASQVIRTTLFLNAAWI